MDARAERVQRELADRDAHAPGSLVAEAEDALVVGDDQEPNLAGGRASEDLSDAAPVLGRDPDAAAATEDAAVALARLPDGGRVDDRRQLDRVLEQQAVEERLVAVLQGGEADVALEGGGLRHHRVVRALDLLLDGLDAARQQALEPKPSALFLGERRPLVEERVSQDVAPAQRGVRAELVGGALEVVTHHDFAGTLLDPRRYP